VVFHVESISSTTFVNHIVYQIALDVYRILNDRHALLATRSPRPVEVKTALRIQTLEPLIDPGLPLSHDAHTKPIR
jgi:hypothetical protein